MQKVVFPSSFLLFSLGTQPFVNSSKPPESYELASGINSSVGYTDGEE